MKKEFKVFFKETEIGFLEVNEEKNLYKYTPNTEGITKVKDQLILPVDLSTTTNWGKPIPFFANRIENCKRFEEETGCKVMGYQTDDYRMVPAN